MSERNAMSASLFAPIRLYPTTFFVIAYLLLCTNPAHAGDAQDAEAREERIHEMFKEYYTIDFGIHLFASIPESSYVPITFDDLPGGKTGLVKYTIWAIPENIFVREARLVDQKLVDVPKSPQHRDGTTTVCILRQPEFEISVYAAYGPDEIDTVRYSWVFRGQKIRMLARRDAARLDLNLKEIVENADLDKYGPHLHDRVVGYLSTLLRLKGKTWSLKRMPFTLKIPWPDSFDEGVKFSSNPDQCLRSMDSSLWFRRVDGYVHDGTLSLIFYMKPGQIMGFRDGSKWFSDEFREWVHKQAAAQNKIPIRGDHG